MIFEKIYELNSFRRQYKNLLILSACQHIPNLNWNEKEGNLLNSINWENMLKIASAFSYSDDRKYLDIALRITQTCLEQESCTPLQKCACEAILNNLTNFRAIELAYNKRYLNNKITISQPISLVLQKLKNEISNTVFIGEEKCVFNRFQKEVYDKEDTTQGLTISSPPSAGKSYVLSRIILKLLEKSSNCNIAYIVPSRALISQALRDLSLEISRHNLQANLIIIPPQKKEKIPNGQNIFIFTQERLHWFLSEHSNFSFNYLFVDEAQEIQSGSRGVLLQKAIEKVIDFNPQIKVYFSSPLAKNPEIFLTLLPGSFSQGVVNTEYVAVNQNLILVQKSLGEHREKIWSFELLTEYGNLKLGSIKRDISSDSKSKLLSSLCIDLYVENKGGVGNIIYANTQSEAENIGKRIADTLPPRKSSQLDALIELTESVIHPEYVLVRLLRNGVAFHYANIPLIIRERILELFSTGEISYLICTSTLLEGVNTPAKSIFLYAPTRGKSTPLNQMDFWNLVGRAGRLGKEFSGNIYCVQLNDWKSKPNLVREKYQIELSINKFLTSIKNLDEKELDNVLKNSTGENSQAISYLYEKYIINKISYKENTSNIKSVIEKMRFLANNISVPDDILKRNPGFTPEEQQLLFDYLQKLNQKHEIEEYVPCHPSDNGAYKTYEKIAQVLNETLFKNRKELSTKKLALFAVAWMRGKPLNVIIEKQIKYEKEKQNNVKVDTTIRKTLSFIENDIRFAFLQAISCYVDMIRVTLGKRANSERDIPDVVTWLELGISNDTELSFLKMGLNRYSAIALSHCVHNEVLQSREQLVNFLRRILTDDQIKIPRLVKEEVSSLIGIPLPEKLKHKVG